MRILYFLLLAVLVPTISFAQKESEYKTDYGYKVGDVFLGISRITSYNVCYTKLLRNNVPDWLTFLFASAKIGAVLVTINTNYKLAELEYLLQDADIHTLCMIGNYRDSDYVNIIFELAPELKNQPRGELKSKKFAELT